MTIKSQRGVSPSNCSSSATGASPRGILGQFGEQCSDRIDSCILCQLLLAIDIRRPSACSLSLFALVRLRVLDACQAKPSTVAEVTILGKALVLSL